ncbi:MAG TPA: NUDIX domain-containing protein [Pirellulaceae bacterium]|nr:NUDIX domain-containing protein [Pirellulaceae bacterium]
MNPKNIPIRKYGVVAVIARENRLLVIERSQLVRAPGMFCFPGGGIEAGEDEMTAVAREVREELGVEIVPQRFLWRYVTLWGVDLAWWLVDLPRDAKLLPHAAEVADCQWLTLREIRALPKLLESNFRFLDACARGEILIEGLANA